MVIDEITNEHQYLVISKYMGDKFNGESDSIDIVGYEDLDRAKNNVTNDNQIIARVIKYDPKIKTSGYDEFGLCFNANKITCNYCGGGVLNNDIEIDRDDLEILLDKIVDKLNNNDYIKRKEEK